jgi:hypothetical protein
MVWGLQRRRHGVRGVEAGRKRRKCCFEFFPSKSKTSENYIVPLEFAIL